MANLALQKFRPGSSILPSSSFRPEPGQQAAELQIDTQNRLLKKFLESSNLYHPQTWARAPKTVLGQVAVTGKIVG